MKIAYFDCFSGISGDMCLGALVDAGVPVRALEKELKKIPVRGYHLSVKKVKKSHFAACKVDVVQDPKTAGAKMKRWRDIDEIVHRSSLSEDVKQKGLGIFKGLFEAEARVHGEPFHNVHLHELCAVDCIMDIFGTVIGLDMLGVEAVYSSPVNLGSGLVKTDSGILPVPAPATAELLKGVPVYSHAVSSELTTPTGAAIVKGLSAGHGDLPSMDIEKIGMGAGSRDFKKWPNVLRILIGDTQSPPDERTDESVIVIETNIDDMNPQIYEYVIERLFKAGALDAYLTQVIMKKGRPASKLTVLCSKERKEELMNIIFRETSTIGLRFYETKRRVLRREIKTLKTEFGNVRMKYSRYGDGILRTAPEYEDCKKIAKRLNIPLIELMEKIKK